jgi:hypothetical protein
MLQIAIQPIPAQSISAVLGGQNCQINIYQKGQRVFVDLNSNGLDIVTGVLAHDVNPLVCIKYTGFQGNLTFVDTQGNDDPQYDGFGSRYVLIYISASDLINLGGA